MIDQLLPTQSSQTPVDSMALGQSGPLVSATTILTQSLSLCPLSSWRPRAALLGSGSLCHSKFNVLNIIFSSSLTGLRAVIYEVYLS